MQLVDELVGSTGRLQGGIHVDKHRHQLSQLDDGDGGFHSVRQRVEHLVRGQQIVRVHDDVNDRVEHHDRHFLIGQAELKTPPHY